MTSDAKLSARALMILGTGSHVGKSILAAALGRILSDEGYRVAPFKAQNMSLNSAATPDGCEIGRAQALQAEACRVTPCAEMNPILIKPSSDTGAQVVVLGKVWGQVSAADYHRKRVEELFPTVWESYQKLASEHEVIVIEGAGSPAEINLREHDIVNMRMARAAEAACLLVGDIDRGGVFASLLGTLELLDPHERPLIRGYAINKFRGDLSLLQPGITQMAPRLGVPCAGVIPYLHDLNLDEEDGVSLEDRRTAAKVWKKEPTDSWSNRPLRVGVVAFPHLSNFTDFDPLASEPSVSLAYLERADEIDLADLVILPGSKQTLNDLDWLFSRDFIFALSQRSGRQKLLMGICGGMQMLGMEIEDPDGMENAGLPSARRGLGLLAFRTKLASEKITRRVDGIFRAPVFGQAPIASSFRGYEIHLGESMYLDGVRPLASIRRAGLDDPVEDGAVSADGRVIGTYVHGIFDDDSFRHDFINAARAACGLGLSHACAFVDRARESRLNRLADHVRQSLDLDLLFRWLGLPQPVGVRR